MTAKVKRLAIVIAAIVVLTVVAFVFSPSGDDTNPAPPVQTPVCAQEDSKSCYWTDPDTGNVYWNNDQAGEPQYDPAP